MITDDKPHVTNVECILYCNFANTRLTDPTIQSNHTNNHGMLVIFTATTASHKWPFGEEIKWKIIIIKRQTRNHNADKSSARARMHTGISDNKTHTTSHTPNRMPLHTNQIDVHYNTRESHDDSTLNINNEIKHRDARNQFSIFDKFDTAHRLYLVLQCDIIWIAPREPAIS